MKKLRICYFSWDEVVVNNAVDALLKMEHDVKVIRYKINNYDFDEVLESEFCQVLNKDAYDLVFSFDYLPIISRCCQKMNVKYVSWVYDSPHYTMESETLANTCNSVFVFDYSEYRRYFEMGISTVKYMPLGCNYERVNNYLDSGDNNYKYDVSFVGSINNNKDYISMVKELPDFVKEYIDQFTWLQQNTFMEDLVNEIPEVIISELGKRINCNLGESYRNDAQHIIKSIIRERVTIYERMNILTKLSENFDVHWFGATDYKLGDVNNHKWVDYDTEMYQVFRQSKINLNITLRTIKEGISLRVFDVLAAGGFLLTSYQEILNEYFTDGEDIVMYKDIEDLKFKIKYYLEHEEERKQIAQNGSRKVKELFDYKNLFEEIFMNS